jgi:hypothetical protein
LSAARAEVLKAAKASASAKAKCFFMRNPSC